MEPACSTRHRLILAACAVTVVALAALGASRVIRPDAFRDAFADVQWTWVALSALAYAACQFTSALVWHTGLQAAGLREIGRAHAIGAHWIARGATEFVPAPVGEAARVAALRRHRVAREAGSTRIVGSIAAYRLVDGAVSFSVVAILVVVMPPPNDAAFVRWLALAVVGALAAGGLVAWRVGPERGMRVMPRRVRPLAGHLADGARLLGSRRHIGGAVALQLLTVAGRIISLAALLVAFGIPAEAAPLVYCLTTLAGLVAISPGGIGVREAAVVPVVALAHGLAAEPVLAFSLAVQATALVVSVVGASAALAAAPPRLRAARAA
jgi:uncharacterized membrane protein YbhN (UPF0104 family)